MSSYKELSDEELKQALASKLTSEIIAKKYGLSVRTIYNRKAALVKRGWSPEHDLNKEAPVGYKLKGTSTLYDANGNMRIQWVKTSEDKEKQLEIMKAAIIGLIEDLPVLEKRKDKVKSDDYKDLLTVFPLGDPHIGMLAWGEETGEDWDLKIAFKVFGEIFDRVVRSAPRCKKVCILNLGDFFHRDNSEGVTSRSGHHLDCDGRYAKMAQIGFMILRRMIESALDYHETVEVKNIPGNHDDVSSLMLSIAFKHIYENEPRVIIDDSPAVFQYLRFGKVLIGAHHGHTAKMEKLAGVMACDRAKEWGETEHRYWLTGHIHHDSKKELPGVMVESFRTLAAKDVYATAGGWRSGRDTKAIVYHKEHGEIERHTINISQMQDID